MFATPHESACGCARREWYKARFADKSPKELKPWEEDLLVELEWEEEWERRELVRGEREAIAQFGDDIDGLRRWFDADKNRPKRHAAEHAALQEREQREQEAREVAGLEREATEIERLGDDIDGLRQWFNVDLDRARRHPLEFADLRRRELRREDR